MLYSIELRVQYFVQLNLPNLPDCRSGCSIRLSYECNILCSLTYRTFPTEGRDALYQLSYECNILQYFERSRPARPNATFLQYFRTFSGVSQSKIQFDAGPSNQ